MTSDASDNKDIKRQIRSIYSRGNMIISKFRKCTIDVKIQLFKTFCTSLYCAHLWSDFSTVVFNKLRVAYNNIFRHLMHIDKRSSISQAFVSSRVYSFYEVLRNNINSFIKRIYTSGNILVNTCINMPHFIYGSKLRNQWNSFLHIQCNWLYCLSSYIFTVYILYIVYIMPHLFYEPLCLK